MVEQIQHRRSDEERERRRERRTFGGESSGDAIVLTNGETLLNKFDADAFEDLELVDF